MVSFIHPCPLPLVRAALCQAFHTTPMEIFVAVVGERKLIFSQVVFLMIKGIKRSLPPTPNPSPSPPSLIPRPPGCVWKEEEVCLGLGERGLEWTMFETQRKVFILTVACLKKPDFPLHPIIQSPIKRRLTTITVVIYMYFTVPKGLPTHYL